MHKSRNPERTAVPYRTQQPPATDYLTDTIRITDYFSQNIDCSVHISVDVSACRRTEQSTFYPLPKIRFMLPDFFLCKRITLRCVGFFVFYETYASHFAFIFQIGSQSRKRNLHELLIVALSDVYRLFLACVVAYN